MLVEELSSPPPPPPSRIKKRFDSMPPEYDTFPQDRQKMDTAVVDDGSESSNSYSVSPILDSTSGNAAPNTDVDLSKKRKLCAGSLLLKGNMTLENQATGFISQTNAIQHIVSDPNSITNVISMKDDSLQQCSTSESSQGCGADFIIDDMKDHGKSHELLQDFSEDAKSVVSCKICGRSGFRLEMLLCDLCEDAFHLPCCIPKLRKPPVDEWHCQSCQKREEKILSDMKSEELGGISGVGNRTSGHIQNMLRDHRPYTTCVSIGNDFQAEVPEWIGQIHGDSGDLGEPSELNPTYQYTKPSGWIYSNPGKLNSMSNWVQCRAIIKTSSGKKTVCGKWRRSPLYVGQSKHWDCSCAVRWDPMHADCAVPQELKTKDVLEHLNFIRKLRGKLAARVGQ